MNYYKQIEDYIEGLLDESAKKAFEEAMSVDSELSMKVEEYTDAKKISEGLLEIDIMETLDNLAVNKQFNPDITNHISEKNYANNAKKLSVKNRFDIKKLMLAASFIGVLLIVGWWSFGNRNSSNDKLYSELYQEPIWPIERSSTSSILSKASGYYLEGNFTRAKLLLLDSIDNKELGKFWIAEMFLKQNIIDSTIFYLPSIESLNIKKNRIIYLNLLIALKNNNLKKAKEFCRHLPKRDFKKVYKELGVD